MIWSTSNIMVVFFRSDNIYEYGGFIASYSFYNGKSFYFKTYDRKNRGYSFYID